MTREELREHCKKQIRACEMWARSQGERPHGKVYEEHKLILELLEQESVIDKMIRAEIEELSTYDGIYIDRAYVLEIFDKYKSKDKIS